MERVVEFGGGEEGDATGDRLVGVLNRPGDNDVVYRRPAALLFNAGIVHRIGPHRLNVKLARALAAKGVASLRFDISGLGDSAPAPAGAHYETQALEDIVAAADVLEADGARAGFIAIGMCSGADNAYRAALADPRFVGLTLLDPYAYGTPRAKVARAMEKATDLGRWKRAIGRTLGGGQDSSAGVAAVQSESTEATDAAPEADNGRVYPPLADFGRDLQALTTRDVKILIRYTTYVEEFLTDPSHFRDAFGAFDFAGNLDVDVDRRADHTYVRLAAQQRLFSRISSWYDACWPEGVAAPEMGARAANEGEAPASNAAPNTAKGVAIEGLRRAGVRPGS